MNKAEKTEWLKKIRLTKYASLKLKSQKTKNDMELMTAIEQTLLDMGIGYDEINNYCDWLSQDNLEERIALKCNEIFDDIVIKIESSKEKTINTHTFPEIYFKIQEIIAMDSELASTLLEEAERQAHIEHVTFMNSDREGNDCGNYTYYFSKK